MGVRYEAAAVDFWSEVVSRAEAAARSIQADRQYLEHAAFLTAGVFLDRRSV